MELVSCEDECAKEKVQQPILLTCSHRGTRARVNFQPGNILQELPLSSQENTQDQGHVQSHLQRELNQAPQRILFRQVYPNTLGEVHRNGRGSD